MRLVMAGFGAVGQGFARLLLEKAELVEQLSGSRPVVAGIATSRHGTVWQPAGLDLAEALRLAGAGRSLAPLGKTPAPASTLDLLRETAADVLLESTWTDIRTAEPATSHIRLALERGMHVITANKGPAALFLPELQELARQRDRLLLLEGTVMSGTPVLNLIRETLAGCRILEIEGILNGTTNFILTRMEEGMEYGDALALAQAKGYAEAVPDADVLGWDTLAKTAILARVAFGARSGPAAYPCQGITGVTSEQIRQAAGRGGRIKLLARIWQENGRIRGAVAPREIPLSHPLAGVREAGNGLVITTDILGPVTVMGPGAGSRETGFALLGDLLHLIRHCRRK